MRKELLENVFGDFMSSGVTATTIISSRVSTLGELWNISKIRTSKDVSALVEKLDKTPSTLSSVDGKVKTTLTKICSVEMARLLSLYGKEDMDNVARYLTESIYSLSIDDLSSNETHEDRITLVSKALENYPFLVPFALVDLVILDKGN